ncbi:MAG: hypothetical protein MUF77_11865, partial [Leptospira sp.]|nr:hypothetical protein [Leptospira sp.]
MDVPQNQKERKMIPWKKLYTLNLISPKGLFWLAYAVWKNGSNAMAVLHYSAKIHPMKIALSEKGRTLTFHELHKRSLSLAKELSVRYSIQKGRSFALIGRNHSNLVQSTFAL